VSRDRRLSVRVTADMERHLAILSDAGLSASDAVREAVRLLAEAHVVIARRAAGNGGMVPGVMTIPTRAIPGVSRTDRDVHDVSRTA
jgi:hypothetical protein